MIFTNDVDEKIGRTMLAGPQYAIDNASVIFELLKSLAGSGPLQPFIQPYDASRNGWSAWKALCQYYDGDSMKAH